MFSKTRILLEKLVDLWDYVLESWELDNTKEIGHYEMVPLIDTILPGFTPWEFI